jgi:uncharacterized protein YcgI (DUF1989 family)
MSELMEVLFRDVCAYSGGWIRVKKGQNVRVIDPEGQQIADTFAVNDEDRSEYLSGRHTRAANRRLFPRMGEAFYTNQMRPILTLVGDTSPGVHDMLWMSCNPVLYRSMGVEGYHPNCHDNFLAAAADAGWTTDQVPDPVNLFQNTVVTDTDEMQTGTALSRPGDAVTLRAEMDLILVVTACSFDLAPINGDRCTGIRLEVAPTMAGYHLSDAHH